MDKLKVEMPVFEVKKLGKREKRKLAIEDLKRTIGWVDDKSRKWGQLWEHFTYPVYIPTEWIEEWTQGVILHYGNKKDYLFKLLEETRKSD